MENSSFDYIVVGSGAGGGPVACNLAQAGHSVLLLEAGGNTADYAYQVPVFHPFASEDPAMSWQFFVRHYASDAQQKLDNKFRPQYDGVFYPRAGTLGGCTGHNAMITVYPFNSDWDYIASLTNDPSWSSQTMRRYFERMEHCTYVKSWRRFLDSLLGLFTGQGTNPSRHGFGGWLNTEASDPTLLLKDPELLIAIISAVIKVFETYPDSTLLELTKKLDPNDWRVVTRNREGLTITPLATLKGCRTGTREYILNTLQQFASKLTLRTNALVTRVVLDDSNRATGVEYLDGAHLYAADPKAQKDGPRTTKTAFATREVILAGGAFNTPQLLMLSGIGPAGELQKPGINIKVKVDLPGVGCNLQDRYEVGVISEFKREFALLKDGSFAPPVEGQPFDAAFQEWLKGKGAYTSNGALLGIIKRSSPQQAEPDLFIFGLPSHFEGYYPGYSNALEHNKKTFTWAILKARTLNHAGTVTLRSADPCDVPDIDFHYFKEGSDQLGTDLEAVVNGVEFVRSLNSRIPELIDHEVLPGPSVKTRADVAQFIQNNAWGHHASCSCKIGADNDPLAVLDSQFRVRGTTGLRVVDASVFPRIPGFFIVSAVYMISEKATDAILADATAGPKPAVLRKTAGA